jgi:hypothetical protein
MSLRLAWKMLLALLCCVALDGCAPWKTWSPKSLFGKSEATAPSDPGKLEEVIAEPAKPRVKPKAKPEAKPEPKAERPSLMSKLTPSFWKKKPASVAAPTKESLATDLAEKEPKLAVRPPAKDTPKLAAKPEDANQSATEPKVATPAKPQPPQIAVQQPPKTESSKPAEAPVPTSKNETGRWMPVQRVAERVKPPADHGFREQAVEPAPVVAQQRADHPANAPASVAADDGDRSESADPTSVATAPSEPTQGRSAAFIPPMPKVEHSEPPAEAAPVQEKQEIVAARPPVEETPFRASTALLATRKSSFQPRTPLPAEPINTASAEQTPTQHAENAPPRGSFFMPPSTPAATPAAAPESTVATSPPTAEAPAEPTKPAPSQEPPSTSKWRGNSSFVMTRPPAEPPAESTEAKASESPAPAPATIAAAPPSASAWRAKAAPSVEKPAAEPITTAQPEPSENAPAVAAQTKPERSFAARQALPESPKSSFRPNATEEEPDLETRPKRQSPSPSTRIVTTPRPAPESQPPSEPPTEHVASASTPVAFARENPQLIRPQVVFQAPPAAAEETEPAPTAKPAAPEVVASESPPSDDDSAFTLGRSITMGAPVKAQDLAVTRPAPVAHKPAPRPVSVMPVEDPVASPKFAKAEPITPRPAAKPPAERQVKAAPTGFARPAVIVVEAEAAPDPDQLPPLRMEEPGDWDRTERSHNEARPSKPTGTGIGTFVNSAPPADELPPILTPEEHARRNAQRRNGR